MKCFLTPLLLISLILCLSAANPQQVQAQSPADFPLRVELDVPMPPTPVKANGKLHLLYELHITNFGEESLDLTRLEVFGDAADIPPLASYQDAELTDRIMRPGILADLPDSRLIGGGLRAVVFLELIVEPSAVPGGLRHRLFFKSDDGSGNSSERVVEGVRIAVHRIPPVVVAAPLRAEGWLAVNGMSNTSGHRRTLMQGDGKMQIAQRFAIDWLQIGPDGQVFHDDPAQNEYWYAYGADVLAVADGVVVDVKDGIPENVPLIGEFAVPITAETIGGNYVILDLGNGNFAYYAHLQPQSLRVKVGDKVRRGQVLGLLGNSGNSDAPHLHFHVTDANALLGAEGIPYVFKTFDLQGTVESLAVFEDGTGWQSEGNAEKRQLELTLEFAVVRFP